MKVKKTWTIVGLLLFCVILVGYWFYPQYFSTFISGFNASMEPQKTKFDVHKEIEILNRSHPSSWGDFYKIKELNWNVWRKQWIALGGTLIRMDTWDDFKESLRQNEEIVLFYELGLDETNRVIWYTIRYSSDASFAVYFQY